MYNKEFAKNLIDQIPDDQMQAVVSYLQNTAKDFCGSSTSSIKNQAPEKPASKEQTDIRKSSITSKTPVSLNNKTILVTGAAGFIGFHLIKRLSALCTGSTLIGVDNLNDYYDPALKEWRIRQLQSHTGSTGCQFNFKKASIADKAVLSDIIPHLSAADRRKPGRTGRRPVQHYQSGRLYRIKFNGILQHTGSLPARRRPGASGIRFFFIRLRRQ